MKSVFAKLGKAILYLFLWAFGGSLGVEFIEAVTQSSIHENDYVCMAVLLLLGFFVPITTAYSRWFIEKTFNEWYSKYILAGYKILLVILLYISILWFYIGLSVILVYVIPNTIKVFSWLAQGISIIVSIVTVIGIVVISKDYISKTSKAIYVFVITLWSIGMLLVGFMAFWLLNVASGRLESLTVIILWFISFNILLYGITKFLDKGER